MEKIFGIDLGTTYSCISHVDEFGKPVVLANFENERTTPSVVFFDENDEKIVGSEAKNMLTTDPDKVVNFIKRSMGDPNFLFMHNDIKYTPEEISSFILRKLVKDASEKVGFEVKDVVITCPAYFGINEREATKKAGEIAGLNVHEIINEPTAAAIAYGIEHAENQTVLVYDLGGGTFDITLIEVKPEAINVVVTGGNHELGGKDWDNAIMGYLAEKFQEETGVDEDIFSDPETFGQLQISAENAKKTLSQREKTKVNVIYGTDKVAVEITRDKFNEITNGLAEGTIALTKQLLEEAKNKSCETFDKILLVGGSTRMPQIKEMLEQNFSGIPVETFDPDESVAKGAAVYGTQLGVNSELIKRLSQKLGIEEDEVDINTISEEELTQAEQEVADSTGFTLGAVQQARKEITNVVSKSFGIEAYNNANELRVFNMILKQNPVPAEITQIFLTHSDNQENVEIKVYENESPDKEVDKENSKELGVGVIEGLPANLPAGSPIEVTFKINQEGRLEIVAVDKTGMNSLNLEIETTSIISDEELEAAKERSKAIKIS